MLPRSEWTAISVAGACLIGLAGLVVWMQRYPADPPARPASVRPVAALEAPAPSSAPSEEARRPTVTWDVHFSPHGGCTAAIVALLAGAKSTIRVQAYGLTSGPIADALVLAKRRGVDVQIVLDRSDLIAPQPTEKRAELVDAGIVPAYDLRHVIAHNKILIVDGLHVETGSFNFTAVAETGNAENCPILTGPAFAAAYTANWDAHRAHSVVGDAGAP